MTKNIVIGVLAVLVLSIGFLYFFGSPSPLFGTSATGPVHYQGETFSGGLQVGARGTFTQAAYSGTCNLSGPTLSATSTAQYYCPVTGVAAGDLVLADLPVGAGANSSGSGSPAGGFVIVSAYATTSNQIGVTLFNLTGAATSSFPQATTSVEYRVLH